MITVELILLVLLIYFLPSIIASLRGHPNQMSVIVVNLFLGWTLVGWVVALAMSVSGFNKADKVVHRTGKMTGW